MSRDWRDYIPTTGHEERGRHRGLLSTTTEVHAVVIGLGVGLSAAALAMPAVLAGFVLLAFGIKAGAKAGEKVSNEAARVEVQREPQYSAAAALIGWAMDDVVRVVLEYLAEWGFVFV